MKTLDVRFGALCSTLGLLAACGGTSISDPMTYEELDAIGDGFGPIFLDSSITPQADVPLTGSATYDGIAFVRSPDVPNIADDPLAFLGQMTIRASFAGAGSVSGTANNFVRQDDAVAEGDVTFDAGAINRGAGDDFSGQMGGEIVFPDGRNFDFANVPVSGNFVNEDAENIAAIGSSTFRFDGDGAVFNFNMGFVAGQD